MRYTFCLAFTLLCFSSPAWAGDLAELRDILAGKVSAPQEKSLPAAPVATPPAKPKTPLLKNAEKPGASERRIATSKAPRQPVWTAEW